jgi:hypothetical protein
VNINSFILPLLISAVVTLSGCGTPIRNMSDSDFRIRSVSLSLSAEAAKKVFIQGLNFCGPEPGGMIFVTHIGSPICRPDDGEELVCDLYIGYPQPGTVGNSRGLLGRVDFKNNGAGSIVEFRRVNRGSDSLIEQTFDLWKEILNGKSREVCTKN